MEVKSSNAGLLTNIEVLELLKERRASSKKSRKQSSSSSSHFDSVDELQSKELLEKHTIKYIESWKSGKAQTSESVGAKLSAVKAMQLGLTEGELIQLSNHFPAHPVEVHLVRIV